MSNLPISRFLAQRLSEYDPTFEVRQGSGFERLFFQPLQFITQPIRDESEEIRIGQSFNLILQQTDPNSFNEEAVDALASNIFVFRRQGGFATGSARVFFQDAVAREYPTGGFVCTAGNGKTFENSGPFKITAEEMSANVFEGLFYLDIPVVATEEGSESQIDADSLVSVTGDDEVVRVTNLEAFSQGADKETNTELIERTRNSIGVRDLTVPKGFRAILFENFKDFLLEAQPIGFSDPEMMRDIIFNTHIGGKVDGYVKTTQIKTGFQDFIGLLIDTTRQTKTLTNIILTGTDWVNVGNQNIDRDNGLAPVLTEIKISTPAEFLSTVNLSTPIDLSARQYIRVAINGEALDIRVAGVNPAATTRTEIVNAINTAFGVNVAFISGVSILIQSPTVGLTSSVVIDNPTLGVSVSAINDIFGLSTGGAPHEFNGDGPVTFLEGIHYEVDDAEGNFRRIEGPVVVTAQTNGETTNGSDLFEDASTDVFLNVEERDIVRITTGDDIGDYRVLAKNSNNEIQLDAQLTDDATNIEYTIFRSGIKDAETVQVEYAYNPLSIDVGGLVPLQTTGDPQNPIVLKRGIRPGRDGKVITDTAFLRIVSIEEIDPLTREATGTLLDGEGGFGQGGFGRGGYGVGEGQDYFLKVNNPYARFSAFEDSYIVIRQGFQGASFRVNYEYVPEINTLHDFVLSETERSLDGDTLMKHMMPAYVSGVIQYKVDSTDSSIPDNTAVQDAVKNFINSTSSGSNLEYSDVMQFILKTVDPFNRYGAQVRYFELEAELHNQDGTLSYINGTDELELPTREGNGQRITNPASPRISRWVADSIIMERIS